MICIGILWNSMTNYNDKAMNDINKLAKIKSYFDINLKDNLSNFIWDVYAREPDIVKLRVQKKIEYTDGMYKNKLIRIMQIDIDEEKIDCDIIEYIKNIKKIIREKYSNRVKYYSYDNVFHLTETKEEFIKVINAIKLNLKENTTQVIKELNDAF